MIVSNDDLRPNERMPAIRISPGAGARRAGVVYVQSDFARSLFALDAATGLVLAQVVIGGSVSGPAIADGQVYIGIGDTFTSGFAAPGAITALGL